jgi:hypothetical protein
VNQKEKKKLTLTRIRIRIQHCCCNRNRMQIRIHKVKEYIYSKIKVKHSKNPYYFVLLSCKHAKKNHLKFLSFLHLLPVGPDPGSGF